MHFSGELDEVRVWSVARSAALIRASATFDTLPPASPGLLAYFPFNEPVRSLGPARPGFPRPDTSPGIRPV